MNLKGATVCTNLRVNVIGMIIAAALVLAAVWHQQRVLPEILREQIAGSWLSDELETHTDGRGTVRFSESLLSIANGSYTWLSMVYADAFRTRKLFTLDLVGSLAVGQLNDVAPNAVNIDFTRDRVSITPLTPDGLVDLTSARCELQGGWTIGTAQELKSACMGVVAPDACPIEYDIFTIRANSTLVFGHRGIDMPCRLSDRSSRLGSHTLSRLHETPSRTLDIIRRQWKTV